MDDLLDALRGLARAVTIDGVRDTERLSRLKRAGEGAQQLQAIATLADPYADGRHDRVIDGYYRDPDAKERLAQYRQAQELRAVAAGVADLSGAYGAGVTPSSTEQPAVAAWIDQYARPARNADDQFQVVVPTSWSVAPDVTIDGDLGALINGSQLAIAGDVLKYHRAALVAKISQQVLASVLPGEIDRAAEAFVAAALERQLIEDLITGLVPGTDLDAAESAIGTAWPGVADLILCSPADRPALRKAYGSVDAGDRPRILATAGATPGSAVMMASSAVFVQATPAEWMRATDPASVGQDVAVVRWGRARARVPGAVAVVTI